MWLLDVVFPTDCAGCGTRGSLACASCLEPLSAAAMPAWPRPAPAGLPPPWAVTAYADPCRALLLAYKERGAIGLRDVLAEPLAVAVLAGWHAALDTGAAAGDPARLFLVPVPSSRRAVRARGDDVVLVLVRRAAAMVRRTGVDVRVLPALRHRRTVSDSAGLSASARAANLAGAFTLRPPARRVIAGATVILADDLITTGVTLAESAAALRSGGAVVVAAATVAATQREHRP